MRRRLFLQSGSAAAVASILSACGGGGGGADAATGTAADAGALSASPALQQPRSAAIPAAQPGTVAYPFGARLDPYAAGIQPAQSRSGMDSLLAAQYDAWKAARVVAADSIVAGGYAVQYSDSTYLTVSEGMGYGMLLAVLFAGHDPQAQGLFDGLLAVVRTRPAYAITPFDPNGRFLMDWRLNADGSSAGEGWNAMDGDLDIALALLMAHRQWGSAGAWNYLQEGRNTIAALKSWNMKPDGTTKGLRGANVNRTSDYMVGHFRAFEAVTGEQLWGRAVDRAYQLADKMQKNFSPGVGLLPDFVMDTDGDAAPSSGYLGDGNDKEGLFWWNACRSPWRFASDYVLSGDARFAELTGRMIDFFQGASGGDPVNIGTGYALDGSQLTGGNSPAYLAPLCAGACVDARFQPFLDALWHWNASHLTTGYYDGEIQLLSLAVASGNWWTPARG